MGVICLPGNKVSAQLDPTLYPPGLSFGSGGAASPVQVIPMLGPANSTGGLCWKYMGGRMAPSPGAAGSPVLLLLGSQGGSCWNKGLLGTVLIPRAMLWHRPTTTLSSQYVGLLSCPEQTALSTYILSPQRGVQREHPKSAPVPKELMDRHRLGRTEEDREGRERGQDGQAGKQPSWGEERQARSGCSAGAQCGAQREVMSLSALSSSSLMALYFIFCAYTSSAGGGRQGADGGIEWRTQGGEKERL